MCLTIKTYLMLFQHMSLETALKLKKNNILLFKMYTGSQKSIQELIHFIVTKQKSLNFMNRSIYNKILYKN
jgi:hypothetical protein